MARLKSVYICESDPSKFFEKRNDAERFDKANEVSNYVKMEIVSSPGCVSEIVDCILKRYDITERYDYVKPAEDVQE